jgi:hypothetical protein
MLGLKLTERHGSVVECMGFNLLLYCCLLLLVSCAAVKKDFIDPAFRAAGLRGSTVSLSCVSQINKPFGLTPHDQRVILEDLKRGILAKHHDLQIVSETPGASAGIKPAYMIEVDVTHDLTERRNNRSKQFMTSNNLDSIPVYTTRTHLRREVRAKFTVINLSSGRRMWQASGHARHSKWYSIALRADLQPYLKPNLGPRLSEILRPVTRKACAKIP